MQIYSNLFEQDKRALGPRNPERKRGRRAGHWLLTNRSSTLAQCFARVPVGTNAVLTARRERPRAPHGRGRREERQPTWKKPGGMGPPGIPSFGGMFPSTGLGAAAALCGEQNQDRHVGFELEFRRSVKAFQPPLFAHLPRSTRCFASVPQSRRSPYYNQGFLL